VLLPSLRPGGPSDGPAWVVSVHGSKVDLSRAEQPPPDALFVGVIDGVHVWAADVSEPDDDLFLLDLMALHARVPEDMWLAAGRAVQLVEWTRNHRYCGRCATPTVSAADERCLRCPACGLTAFPRLAPAIITLVERDGRALLARNANWPTEMYSCLAGFVEPGETLESALRREVQEEVGIEVGDVRYFASQPWPFPHSLMVGFFATYEGGDIAVDGKEISDARWFSAAAMPQIPGPISIARRLIDDWLARSGSLDL
jgi:NAD+ diphosphatase